MSNETHQEKAAYLLRTDGTLALNSAGVDAEARYRTARTEHQALKASWAGAFLARLFRKHVWLDAVTLSFAVTAEYDDSGGYYRCVNCQAQAVRAAPQQALPEEVFPDGEFDPDAALRIVEEEIQDDNIDLYTSLAELPQGYDDLNVALERGAIAALLTRSPLNGGSALEAWGLARPAGA